MSRASILRAVTKGPLCIFTVLLLLLIAGCQVSLAQTGSPPVQAKAAQPGGAGLHVLEFGAVWCAPCKKFAPIFEKVKAAYASKATFESYDIEKGRGPAFRVQYNINAVPTVIILDSQGKVLFQHAGLMTQAQLTAAMDKAQGQ